jgi:hypothetical protein
MNSAHNHAVLAAMLARAPWVDQSRAQATNATNSKLLDNFERMTSAVPPVRSLSSNLKNMKFMNRNTVTAPVSTAEAASQTALLLANASSAAPRHHQQQQQHHQHHQQHQQHQQQAEEADSHAAPEHANADEEKPWVVADLIEFGHVRASRSIQTHSNLLSPIADLSASADGPTGRRSIGKPVVAPPRAAAVKAAATGTLSRPAVATTTTATISKAFAGQKRPASAVADDLDDSSDDDSSSSSSSPSAPVEKPSKLRSISASKLLGGRR